MLKELSFLSQHCVKIGGQTIAKYGALCARETMVGLYKIWRENDDELIFHLSSNYVNKLAGFDITLSATPSGSSSAPGE